MLSKLTLQKVENFKKLMFVRTGTNDKIYLLDYQCGIKDLRKQLNLNTEKFGEKFGVSKRTVESWEQGLRDPSSAVLILMKNLLKKD